MAMSLVRRLAARAQVPVFVARGLGSGLVTAELRAHRGLRLVDSPRHATVLLAAGEFPDRWGEALARVHDQLPHPRGVVWWRPTEPVAVPAVLRDSTVIHELAAVADAVSEVHRRAILHETTTPDCQPDRPPHAFAGRGDHGQGGEGMMGGVPYGRPMAMTVDDRDGLQLDRLELTFGPFTPGFPPGLFAHVQLQGEIVQALELERLDEVAAPPIEPHAQSADLLATRHRLRWLSEMCAIGGLPALAGRAAAMARAVESTTVADIQHLGRAIRRSGLLWQWKGIGRIEHPDGHGDDIADRLRAGIAGCQHGPSSEPTGATPCVDLDAVAGALVGADWTDAVVTIASLDLSGHFAGPRHP